MAETLKRLGATEVVANTDTELYGPGATTTGVVSTIAVCNKGATNRTFRLAHVDGAAIAGVAAEDYFAYDHTILANSSQFFQLGVTFSGNDTILVRASHADVVFIAWGSEIA